jgi:hypothetical protein
MFPFAVMTDDDALDAIEFVPFARFAEGGGQWVGDDLT